MNYQLIWKYHRHIYIHIETSINKISIEAKTKQQQTQNHNMNKKGRKTWKMENNVGCAWNETNFRISIQLDLWCANEESNLNLADIRGNRTSDNPTFRDGPVYTRQHKRHKTIQNNTRHNLYSISIHLQQQYLNQKKILIGFCLECDRIDNKKLNETFKRTLNK